MSRQRRRGRHRELRRTFHRRGLARQCLRRPVSPGKKPSLRNGPPAVLCHVELAVKTRVIPVLLLEDGGLVKTVQFKNASYVGDPINAVRIFCGKEVDELTLLDIGATRAGSGPNFDVLNDIVSEAFMPVAYGGGI